MRKRIGGALGRLLDRAARWVFDIPASPAAAYVYVDRDLSNWDGAVTARRVIVYDGTAPGGEIHTIGPGRP